MITNPSYQISLAQYTLFIYLTQVGIGVLTLPRDLAELAGTDGWISILLGWIVSVLVSILIIRTMERHPNETLFDLLPRYFGKWLGRGIVLLWVLYAVFTASVVMMTTIHVMKVWILPQTEAYILMMLFIIPIYLITQHGVTVIGRFAEIVFFITLWMPVILLFSLADVEWRNLLPIGKEGMLSVITATRQTALSFIGFEMAYLLYPFLSSKRSAYKGIIVANTLSMLIFMMVTIFCYVRFSQEEVKSFLWPTLHLLKQISFPFMERFEIIFLSAYLLILFMTIIPYLYLAVFGTSKLTGSKDHRPFLRVVLFCWIVLYPFYVPTHNEVSQLEKWSGNLGLLMSFLFSFFIWLYIRIVAFISLKRGK